MRFYNKLKFYFYRLDFITFIRVIFFELFTKVNIDLAFKYSFSHAGEDLHIISLLNLNRPGFYIDVGSNHPIRHSNTFKLYLNGWSGLLLDANPILINKSKEVCKSIDNQIEYCVECIDLRDKKGRWDDLIFLIRS